MTSLSSIAEALKLKLSAKYLNHMKLPKLDGLPPAERKKRKMKLGKEIRREFQRHWLKVNQKPFE